MEGGDVEMSTNNGIGVEVLEEVDAVKAIYDGQVTSAMIDNQSVAVTLSDAKLLMTFNVNGNYPDQIPGMKILTYIGDPLELMSELEKCAVDNLGLPMLYILLSKAFDIISSIEFKNTMQTKTPCKFYKEGKCRFGMKCFNLHYDLESNTNITSEENLNWNHMDTDYLTSVVTKSDTDESRLPPNLCKINDQNHITNSKHKTSKKESSHGSEKKKSMKTATDVINRILWDDDFPTENFIVGYLDRFIGVQEKPFTAFSWEDLASVDYNVLAIPKHRIQYFKYKNVVVWDKNERLDLVFGSTGSDLNIMDIIESESVNEMNVDVMNDDIDEDDEHDTHYKTQNRPNYFMVLRVTDDEVSQNIVKVQDGITYYDDRLQSLVFKPQHFHITLCMMRLNNEGDFIKAGTVLKSLERILVCMHPLNKSFLTLKGITDFRGQVIIAKLLSNPLFCKFVEIAKLRLKDAGIKLVGNHEPYTPHLTLLKLSRPFCKQNNMETINNMYYSEFKDLYIGKQVIDELRICSTGEERGYDDFYVSLSTISNNLLCISSKLPTLISIFVQKLMSAGLILEDEGDNMLSEILSNDPKRFEKIVLTLEELLLPLTDFYAVSRKHVIIMRGLPGSGKSYFVRKLHQTSEDVTVGVCSADHYFQKKASGYKFSDDEIASAHVFCQEEFVDCIAQKQDVIIVDNTHLQKWEYQIYQRIALLCGYNSHVISINASSETSRRKFYNRCSHDIKPHVFKDMAERFEMDDDAICIDNSDVSFSIDDLISYGSLLPLCSSSVLYSALYLDENSKDILSTLYPPIHEKVTCDHVTLIYGPSITDLSNTPVGEMKTVKVTGYISNDCMQAVLVDGIADTVPDGDERKHHVTISTNSSTPPKDVLYWLHYLPCIPAKADINLTGVIGIQIATSKTRSTKCLDSDQFSSILTKLGGEKQKKPGSCQENNLSDDDDADIDVDASLYFGPGVIKSLYVFDFDGTLFNTPDPAGGRAEYQNVTGYRWPHKGWLGQPGSLQYPLRIYPGPSLHDYFEHYDRACSKTVLLTGRMERVRSGLQPVLDMHGLSFDGVILKPECASRKEASTVHGYKRETVKNLMKDLPHLEKVKFWDDRIDNIEQLKNLQKTIKDVKIETFHVDATTPNFDNMTISNLLERMGVRPSLEFNAGVKEGLGYISNICKDVLGITDESDILFPFGSYLLKRRGDVDVCVLAPKDLIVNQYITKIGEKAKSYGLEYVHMAPGIRCPVVKLKLEYLNLPPIEFDIVFASVLDKENDNDNLDIEALHRNCADAKSKAALDGVLFFDKIVAPVLDRVDVFDFGIVVDVINVLLKRNNLKGNVFHCIRTFHIVKLLANFIKSCSNELLPVEGWQNLKDFEKFLGNFLCYLSEKSAESYKKLFKGFVPDSYIEPLRNCFLQSSGLGVLDLLFMAPIASPNVGNVILELKCKDKVQLWRGMCIAEARLGSCIRKLIQNGVEIHPVSILGNTIAFNAIPLDMCHAQLMAFKKELSADLPQFVSLKLTLP